MKFSPRWRVAGALAFSAFAIWSGVEISRKAKVSPEPVQSVEERRTDPRAPSLAVSAAEGNVSSPAAVAGITPATLEVTLEHIEAAESPASLAPYLSSAVPEVRAAAVDALIRLGDSATVPLLETAAHQLPAEDAAPLLEAARFLALPDATGFLSKKAEALSLPKESGDRKPRMMGRKPAGQTTPAEDDSPPR